MRRRALSLVELIVAVGILALMVVPLFTGLHTTNAESERLAEELVAANIGSSLLEMIGRVPWSQLPVVPADTPDTALAALFADPTLAPPLETYPASYSRLVTIEDVSGRVGHLKQITVKVVWQPAYLQQKSTRTMTLSSLVTDDTEDDR